LTRPEIRGIFSSERRRFPCRFCPAKFDNFDGLRFHAQTEHQREFHKVNRSLAVIDAKLRSLEKLAQEGMIGCREDYVTSRGNRFAWALEGIAPDWQHPVAAIPSNDDVEDDAA
jgi:hypothetical protein